MPANGKRLRRSTQHTCTSVKARCKHVRGSARDLVHPPALACGVQNKRVKGKGARARERARAPAPRAIANTTHQVTHYHTRRGTGVTRADHAYERGGTSKLNSPHSTHIAIHAGASKGTHTHHALRRPSTQALKLKHVCTAPTRGAVQAEVRVAHSGARTHHLPSHP